MFGGDPTVVLFGVFHDIFVRILAQILLPLLSMPVTSVILELCAPMLDAYSVMMSGWYFLLRVLFGLSVIYLLRPQEQEGVVKRTHRRLSSKKWRAYQRYLHRLDLAKLSPEDQRRFSGRRYFDRAAETKRVRSKWKRISARRNSLLRQLRRFDKAKRATSKLHGDYEAAYEKAFQNPAVADWNTDDEFDMFSWDSYDELFPSYFDFVAPDESVIKQLPFSEHDPDEVARLVANLDNPTRLVTSFIGLTPRDHARNIESSLAVLRAEIRYHESTFDRMALKQYKSRPSSDPTFLKRYQETPCVVDTGASYGLTPFKEDFLSYESCNIKVKAVANENTVIGMGIVLYKMRATNGDTCYVPGIAYHMPECGIRLMSPQAYHQQFDGHSEIDGEKYTFFLAQAANGPRKHVIQVPIESGTNLPMMRDVSTTGKEKEQARPYFARSLRMHQHFSGSFFGRWRTTYCCEGEDEESYEFTPFMHYSGRSQMEEFNNCVSGERNPNLSPGQKELLTWHYRLGISLRHVQYLMQSHEREDAEGNSMRIGAVIPTEYTDSRHCSPTITCATCEIAKGRVQKPKNKSGKRDKKQDKALTKEKYMPGDFVSMDTVPVGVAGRAFSTRGGPNAAIQYSHLTLFHDAATGLIKIYLQENGSTAATLWSKQQFERFLWTTAGVTVKHYHSDQGSNFTDATFAADVEEKQQTQSFSGTGAKFENGSAERAVQTVFWKARHMMLQCALRWDLEGAADPSLWPQALLYACWLYNRIPKMETSYSPLELLTSRRDDHHDLLRAKVWGCPAFVLDPVLQDGKKLPKFKARARVSQFMGFSEDFSSLVGQVRNLKSGSITQQYHVVYDEKFEAVIGLAVEEHEEDLGDYTQKLWEHLFQTDYARDFYIEPQFIDGELAYEVPPLHDEWLSPQEVREKEERLQDQIRREMQRKQRVDEKWAELLPKTPTADRTVQLTSDGKKEKNLQFSPAKDRIIVDQPSQNSDNFADGVSSSPEGASDGVDDSEGVRGSVDVEVEETPGTGDVIWNSRRKRTTWKERYADTDYVSHVEVSHTSWKQAKNFTPEQFTSLSLAEKAVLRSPKLSPFFGNFEITLMNDRQLPPQLRYHPLTRDPIRHPNEKVRIDRTLAHQLARDKAATDLRCAKLEEVAPTLEALQSSRLSQYITLSVNNCDFGGGITELVCQDVHPAFLNAKLGISRADNPGWDEAMNGPEAAEFWKAAEVEIATLEKMKAWDVVDRPTDKPILPSLWAFKKKRLPSGEVRKYKARFTARGDRQTPDVDFTETWAPVVQWTTVRMILILATQLGLKTWSADVSCAFLHSDIDSEVYVDMPRGFTKPGKCLKLRKSLYGLRQSPRLFWKYLANSMESCGLKQSKLDPCLFLGPSVVALCYVDDILFFAKEDEEIEKLMISLRKTGLMLEKETSAAGFLGVDIQPTKFDTDGNVTELELTQCGLIDRIITNLGLDGKDYVKYTPVDSAGPLTKDVDGEPCIEAFSFPAVVGQLLYLTGHSRPELAFAVNQCARYMFNPKRSHELALLRIGKYLKATRTKGLIIKPSGGLFNIHAYPDADFAGLYGHEDPSDPACVKSRTGFVIKVANCPISWKSTLQTKTALSTMEAEISALAHCMKELLGIMDLAQMFAEYYGLEKVETQMDVHLHEDNAGALVLANTLPPEFTPRSKFYHIETIWFREQINLRGIKVNKVATVDQLGDIFTKGLSRQQFEYLRNQLCGW